MTEQQPDPGKGIVPAYAASMPAPQGGALPTRLEWDGIWNMAETLAGSNVIPYRLKGKPADVAVILLAAREYGIPPLMALSKLPVVNGTPAPMGELMVALVLRAGHSIRVTVEGEGGPFAEMVAVCTTRRRGDDVDDVLRFTFREAVTAGLVALVDGKPISRDDKDRPQPWELYTVNMLRWRAVANACRLRFPDVLLGMSYLPEELGAIVDAEGAPVDVEVVRQTPTGSIEDRTAQESADKLTEQPWPDHVLDAVRKAAEDGGYLESAVHYAGETMTLGEALTRHVEDRRHADTVDAELVTTTASEYVEYLELVAVPGGPGELTAAMVTEIEGSGLMDEPVKFRGNAMTLGGALTLVKIEASERANPPATRPPDTPPAAQEPAQEAPAPVPATEDTPDPAPAPQNGGTEETPEAAALDVAREALVADDADVVLSFYNGSADLLTIDVAEAIDDDDLSTIGLNPDEVRGLPVPLGGLLIKVGQYVKRHGNAVRYAGRPTTEDTPMDPWAQDAAAGWPDTNKGPE